MTSSENIYSGGSYGFDSSIGAAYGVSENYGEAFLNVDYRISAGQIGFPTDPLTANQIQATSNKISTGTKTIEVSGLNLQAQGIKAMENIPKQFFKEINRLKKLTGVDLTFHGPLIEPTGFQGRQGWREVDREQAERQMIHAVRRSHELDPTGNMIVTFHSSVSLLEPETYHVNEKGEKVLKEFFVVDESNGQFANIASEINYLKGEKPDPNKLIQNKNEESWFRELQHVVFNISQGENIIEGALSQVDGRARRPLPEEEQNALLNLYKKTLKGEEIKEVEEYKPAIKDKMDEITRGDIYLRESYGGFQNLFNTAYKATLINGNVEDRKKLDKFKEEIAPKLKMIEDDPSKVRLLADELTRGINILRSVNTPQTFKPLHPWAVEKSAETFANVALDSYNKFKKNAPIISIENAPAGTGLSTADDLRKVVDKARDKFIETATQKFNLSKSEAKEQAEKLIGVTWDVGHINLLRGKGYSEKDVIKQTEQISKYVKHIHLSDNFGMEHTELPMGMGNVPTKEMLDLLHKYNKKVKHIVETGDWYSRQGGLSQTQTPIGPTFRAFGPSVSVNEGPYWNQVIGTSGGYFSGQGNINPQVHHSMYGAGFSNLPLELGGQMAGQSRVSGTPID